MAGLRSLDQTWIGLACDSHRAGMPSPALLDYLKAVQTLAGDISTKHYTSRVDDQALPHLPPGNFTRLRPVIVTQLPAIARH